MMIGMVEMLYLNITCAFFDLLHVYVSMDTNFVVHVVGGV